MVRLKILWHETLCKAFVTYL